MTGALAKLLWCENDSKRRDQGQKECWKTLIFKEQVKEEETKYILEQRKRMRQPKQASKKKKKSEMSNTSYGRVRNQRTQHFPLNLAKQRSFLK